MKTATPSTEVTCRFVAFLSTKSERDWKSSTPIPMESREVTSNQEIPGLLREFVGRVKLEALAYEGVARLTLIRVSKSVMVLRSPKCEWYLRCVSTSTHVSEAVLFDGVVKDWGEVEALG